MPWRTTSDPYRILVSEIMLQQTRAQSVIPYYERFIERFPTPADLARARESDVLHGWSGLGYYQRARNLQRAAVRIVELGAFPGDYDGIRALPGVGPYTAAAVGSIAFALRLAVVDGNVLRVIARLTGDSADVGAPATKARFEGVATRLLGGADPGRFNQAMMELGATICMPRNPQCLLCPVSRHCQARIEGRQSELPVKLNRIEPVRVSTTLLVIERRGKILLRRRDPALKRLGGFWVLPSTEEMPSAKTERAVGSFRHSITNCTYTFTVVKAKLYRASHGFEWVDTSQLRQIPLSTTTKKALALAL